MRYMVTNGGLSVGSVKITAAAISSVFFVGDCEKISLSTIFETPPENVIVGVTTGISETTASVQKKSDMPEG